MRLRGFLSSSFIVMTFLLGAQQIRAADIEPEEKPDEAELGVEYLDGFVGVGGGVVTQFSKGETGTRELVHVEFARLRRWISIDGRAGFGKGYSDFGGLFRVFKHWKFDKETSTGFSLGLGLGAMYSEGLQPKVGEKQQAFLDITAAPFVRYIWDFGTGYGMDFNLELQIIPVRNYMNKDNQYEDGKDLRTRVMVGLSFLFEVG
jgi:hypothetical protein